MYHPTDGTYHDLCYTRYGALPGMRNISMMVQSDDPLPCYWSHYEYLEEISKDIAYISNLLIYLIPKMEHRQTDVHEHIFLFLSKGKKTTIKKCFSFLNRTQKDPQKRMKYIKKGVKRILTIFCGGSLTLPKSSVLHHQHIESTSLVQPKHVHQSKRQTHYSRTGTGQTCSSI